MWTLNSSVSPLQISSDSDSNQSPSFVQALLEQVEQVAEIEKV